MVFAHCSLSFGATLEISCTNMHLSESDRCEWYMISWVPDVVSGQKFRESYSRLLLAAIAHQYSLRPRVFQFTPLAKMARSSYLWWPEGRPNDHPGSIWSPIFLRCWPSGKHFASDFAKNGNGPKSYSHAVGAQFWRGGLCQISG